MASVKRARRRRAKRSRRRYSTTTIWLAISMVGGGLLLKAAFGMDEGVALAVLGLAIFVVSAWRIARPEEGGRTGPDMTPWGV